MMKCTLTWETIKDGELKAECNAFLQTLNVMVVLYFFLSALITERLVLLQVHKVETVYVQLKVSDFSAHFNYIWDIPYHNGNSCIASTQRVLVQVHVNFRLEV